MSNLGKIVNFQILGIVIIICLTSSLCCKPKEKKSNIVQENLIGTWIHQEYDGSGWTSSGAYTGSLNYLGGCGTQTAALGAGGWMDLRHGERALPARRLRAAGHGLRGAARLHLRRRPPLRHTLFVFVVLACVVLIPGSERKGLCLRALILRIVCPVISMMNAMPPE